MWMVFTAIFLGISVAWSLATPIPSGPDEPTQYVKGAAVVRGTLTGTHPPGTKPGTANVRVPANIDILRGSGDCYYSLPHVPAGCSSAPSPGPQLVESSTYIAYYPPLYYAIVGLPSLVSTSHLGLRAMRLLSALVESLFLGWAFALAIRWSRSRWMLIGLTVAVTPMAFYLMSVLVSSGFEVTAAAVVWTSGVLLVFEHSEDPPAPLVVSFVLSALILAFTRPLSPAFVGAILLALIAFRPRNGRALLAHRGVRGGMSLVVAGALGATAYVLVEHAYIGEHFYFPPNQNEFNVIKILVGTLPADLRQLIGGFGTPDTPAPVAAVVLCTAAAGLLVGLALFFGRRWDAAMLALVAVAVLVALPVVASLPSVRTHGVQWQGRYGFPLAFGLPVLAAAIADQRRLPLGRAGIVAPVAASMASLVSLYWVLRRYTVGFNAAVNPLAPVPLHWLPPVPVWALTALALGATIAYCLAVWLLSAERRTGDGPAFVLPEDRSGEEETVAASLAWPVPELDAPPTRVEL